MMINVKGTRTKAAAAPKEAYVSPPEKKRTKSLFGLAAVMFAPLILYIAKLMSREAEADEAVGPQKEASEQLQPSPLIEAITEVSGRYQQDEASYGMAELPDTITFLQPTHSLALPVFRPVGFAPGQANDNMGPGTRDALHQSGTGGSSPVAAVPAPGTGSPGFGGQPGAPVPGPSGSDGGGASGEGDGDTDEGGSDGGSGGGGSDDGSGGGDSGDGSGGGDSGDGSGDGGSTGDEGTSGGDGSGEGDSSGDGDDEDGRTNNRAPVVSGPVILPDIFGCGIALIALSDLLRNAIDPDGDALRIEDISVTSGTLSLKDGDWAFDSDGTGPVTLHYNVSDGEISVAQTAHFEVHRAAPILGTEGDDLLIGTMCGEDIDGGAGNDNIDARAGDDVIRGGDGDDHVVAGAGNDVVWGGAGNDFIFGGAGDDHLSGDAGHDRIYGDGGNDVIFGGAGDDFLDGGDGDDIVDAGAGDDVVNGGAGNDVIRDGAGADHVQGGSGDDHLIAALDAEDDVLDGGSGRDSLDYSDAMDDIRVDLVAGKARGAEIGRDEIQDFEVVMTGAGDDLVVFGDAPVTVFGGEGCNTFDFSSMSLPEEAGAPIHHTISDFKVGDRIMDSAEKLYEDVFERIEDAFERVYDSQIELDCIPIRYAHDRFEDITKGRIEVDIEGNGNFELVIMLGEQHSTLLMETA